MKTQVPNIGVIGKVATLRAQPLIRVIDERIGQRAQSDRWHGNGKRGAE
ncbi:hypothetical protein IHE32_10495 [Mycetohabitans rhizoxinica]